MAIMRGTRLPASHSSGADLYYLGKAINKAAMAWFEKARLPWRDMIDMDICENALAIDLLRLYFVA
jgi:hypothetical protein